MSSPLDLLEQALRTALGERIVSLSRAVGEITITLPVSEYEGACRALRDHEATRFEQLIDLCGIDYSDYKQGAWGGQRFAVVLHLLSLTHNWRVRVRVFCPDDDFPVVPSVVPIWNAANWFEREAFDFFGILFDGHADLRRILTDYGFIGHPFRKDFPVSGHVEMRYDPEQKRVIYQPVTIEPREITPRIIREDGYAGLKH
ncbi:MAG: NADH-quinone oxidoreductase subunit C [Betaproteobacteria bacterium]|nr:NADH-quinone oxidoreductase subunit C [Betaproteobacteria bacterium]